MDGKALGLLISLTKSQRYQKNILRTFWGFQIFIGCHPSFISQVEYVRIFSGLFQNCKF